MLDKTEILNAKILIVDDQKTNVLLLEHILLKAGYNRVTSTMNPQEVCALHLEHRYDLILLDLQMPEMDGFQVMEGLKKIDKDGYFPVLVITAQPNHKLRALQAGARDFICKPFDLIEVQTRIHNMLQVRILYQKLNVHNEQLEKMVIERTAQLHTSEARFKSFTELVLDWYWKQGENGKFTTVSNPVLKMLGIESPKTNNTSTDRSDPVEHKLVQTNNTPRRPFLDFVYTIKKNNGALQYLQVSCEPTFDSTNCFVGYRGIGVEITDRHCLDHERNYFRKAMDVADMGVCLINPRTMSIINVSDAMCEISGYNRAEFSTLELTELDIGNYEYLTEVFNTLMTGGLVPQKTENLRCKNDAICAVMMDFQAFNDEGNWVIVCTITKKISSELLGQSHQFSQSFNDTLQ